jgi:hypothetical protein
MFDDMVAGSTTRSIIGKLATKYDVPGPEAMERARTSSGSRRR